LGNKSRKIRAYYFFTARNSMNAPQTLSQQHVRSFLTPRPKDSHKGQFGKVAIIGGNHSMVGAALLAGRAALKLGAGSVHVGLLAENSPSVDFMQPELMLHPAHSALRLPKLNVIAIGCGMGIDLAAQQALNQAIGLQTALILDADALNLLTLRPDLRTLLIARNAPTVITPHPGEAATLLGCSTKQIQAERTEAAQELSHSLKCGVVLKGAQSVCVTRDGTTYLNTSGNSGMSSAGMGDVLTGIIAAFIAQGLDTDKAMLLGVYLHGAAGDALAQQLASIGMSATEVTEWARWLLNQWIP
jgi:ADP-dependent NAD(P)H-hydrate dehydratase / NAD(P)H-hydrate epimerase